MSIHRITLSNTEDIVHLILKTIFLIVIHNGTIYEEKFDNYQKDRKV